jgi:DNA-binding FadR family transcriptional regulator
MSAEGRRQVIAENGVNVTSKVSADSWDETVVVDDGRAAFTQLQAFLTQQEFSENGRLPAERELCDILGVSRGALRKALAIAEAEGRIWRHVGKGTFLGAKPVSNLSEVATIAHVVSPAEVLKARLLIEPLLSREAALHASAANLAELELCARHGRKADSWRRYENWDNRFHRAIASATQNRVLIMLFDNLNNVRRTTAWGRNREGDGPPSPDHHSFAEHDEIVQAITDRDPVVSEALMRRHIGNVTMKMLGFEIL